ncbi:SdpI family protein [Flavobacterium beibuense]|uniref:Putative membrane protein n=1 Tax=Flavobacterium beibuense TaxID=657326 RepID=A0A444WF23_9FLAO|nr:SdpI family protein [Flavobacterium beibuense]RYJ44405.1 putative membrane protein [Flavobacterium beibuense]
MNINCDSQSLSVLGLSGIIFIIVGGIMIFFPPKKINHLYGYRTSSSMSSQERWDFAQRHSALLLIKGGAFMTVMGIAISLLPVSKSTDILLSTPTLLAMVFLLFFKTERALRKRFGKN